MTVHKAYTRRSVGGGGISLVRPRFRDFHQLRMEGGCEYPEHVHREYEVIWVDRGPYRCALNDDELVVEKNRLLVIRPGDRHQDHLADGQLHYVLHFDLEHPLLHSDIRPARQISSRAWSGGRRFFQELAAEADRKDLFSASLQDALLEAFFWRVVRLLPAEGLSPIYRAYDDQQLFLRQLLQAFEFFHRQNATVDDFAAALDLSRRTLTTRCRELLNDPPAAAFARFRCEKAKTLLLHTDLSVKRISADLGFDNPFHFSRTFKRFLGRSPKHFRENRLPDELS